MLIYYDFSDFHIAKVIYKLHLCKKNSDIHQNQQPPLSFSFVFLGGENSFALLVLRQDRSALRFNNTKFIAESSLRFTNYIQNTECANHFYTISNYLYTFYI